MNNTPAPIIFFVADIVKEAELTEQFPRDYEPVLIEWRGVPEEAHTGKGQLWTVTYHGGCLSKDGVLDSETKASSRTEEWQSQHRYGWLEANDLADKFVKKRAREMKYLYGSHEIT